MADAAALAATYFRAWQDRDFGLYRSVLAEDVTFDSPMGQARNADECVQGIKGLSQIVTSIVIRRVFVDGDDVTTWFELHTSATPEPLLVANWSHVRDGKIAAIRVAFDPRPLG
jgi:ketosteroid isomerase-like protein